MPAFCAVLIPVPIPVPDVAPSLSTTAVVSAALTKDTSSDTSSRCRAEPHVLSRDTSSSEPRVSVKGFEKGGN